MVPEQVDVRMFLRSGHIRYWNQGRQRGLRRRQKGEEGGEKEAHLMDKMTEVLRGTSIAREGNTKKISLNWSQSIYNRTGSGLYFTQ